MSDSTPAPPDPPRTSAADDDKSHPVSRVTQSLDNNKQRRKEDKQMPINKLQNLMRISTRKTITNAAPAKFRKGDIRKVPDDHVLRILHRCRHAADVGAGRECNEKRQ